MMARIDGAADKLGALGYTLPLPEPKKYDPVVISGNLAFVSGHGPRAADGTIACTGQLGIDVTLDEGYAAARLVAVNCLASLKHAIGSLDDVARIVKVLGFVASGPSFTRQPEVMHGFSDLLIEVFGPRGRHARSAIGTNVLPGNQSVEVEMIVELKTQRIESEAKR